MTNRSWKLSWVLLAGLVLGWIGAKSGGLASADARAAVSGAGTAGNLIALTAQANEVQLLYLIDPSQQVFSVYELNTKKGKLKLTAVRQYSADHQLSEYNNEPPQVAEIEVLLRQSQRQ